jgi:hypothetical protein
MAIATVNPPTKPKEAIIAEALFNKIKEQDERTSTLETRLNDLIERFENNR